MASLTAEEEEEMRRQIMKMQTKSDKIVNEDLDRTRNMVKLVEEEKDTSQHVNVKNQSEDIGMKTLVKLDEHGERLNNIEEDLEQFNDDMNEAEENIVRLNRCCGLGSLCSGKRRYKKYQKKQGEKKPNNSPFEKKKFEAPKNYAIDNSLVSRDDPREVELEANLRQVDVVVDHLQSIADQMGPEIEKQTEQVIHITESVQCATKRVKVAKENLPKTS